MSRSIKTLSSLQEAAELVTASQQTIEQAAEALRLADAKFHAGSATQLDVLTSQVSLTQAKTDQLTAHYNYACSSGQCPESHWNERRALSVTL